MTYHILYNISTLPTIRIAEFQPPLYRRANNTHEFHMSRKRQSSIDSVQSHSLTSVPTAQLADRRRRQTRGIPTHLPIWKQVLVLSFWPMLEQVMNWLVWFVDTYLAGHLAGKEESLSAMNAIGSGSYWVWLMTMILGAVGVGGAAIISRAFGANRYRFANLVLGQTILLSLILGFIAAFVFTLSAHLVGQISGLTGRSLELCTLYTTIVALSSPAYGILFTGAACLRAAGDFRTPFTIMVVVNIVNMIASYTFVHAPAPYGQYGVLGIAIGTLIAWCFGAFIMMFILIRGNDALKLSNIRFYAHRHTIRKIVKIGIPSMMENTGWWFGGFLILIIVGSINETAVGAHIVTIRLEGISFLPGYALSLAVGTMVGQYLGAKNPTAARHSIWVCWGYGVTLMVLLGVAFMLFPRFWVSLITDKQEMIDQVAPLLFTAGWGQIGFATAMIINGALRGAGDTRTVMILSFVPLFLYRVPVVYLVGYVLEWGMVAVWTVLSIDLLIRGVIVFTRFMHGGWAKIRI